MKSDTIHNFFGPPGKIFPLKLMQVLHGSKVLIPLYHAVSNVPLPHLKHLYHVNSPENFEKDIKFLVQYFQPATLEEVYQVITGRLKPKNTLFHLTFDDGLKEFKSYALPILEKYNLQATLFVNYRFTENTTFLNKLKNSILIDKLRETPELPVLKELSKITGTVNKKSIKHYIGRQQFDEITLNELAGILDVNFSRYFDLNPPYLTLEELKELPPAHVQIGSHGAAHPDYSKLSTEEQMADFREGLKIFNHFTEQKIKAFAFPFSDLGVKKEFFRMIKNEIDITFGTSGLKEDEIPFHVQRIAADGSKQKLSVATRGEYLYGIIRKFLNRNKRIH
ncbi:MAG: polysaccharide deacetylase family protein [Bacteroidota bacterium]